MEALVGDRSIVFDSWRFDRHGRTLSRIDSDGTLMPIALGSRAVEVLALLLERPGELVTKDALMAAVWPGIAVEPNNLTVQMAALRRVLDEGRAGESCIQTVQGRGYRFIGQPTGATELRSTEVARASEMGGPEKAEISAPRPHGTRRVFWLVAAGATAFAMTVGLAFSWQSGWPGTPKLAPPLSIVVLPFVSLDGNQTDASLADTVTDDLATDLSIKTPAFVMARQTGERSGQNADSQKIGPDLGVRFVLSGSVRKFDRSLWVNAQLISTETGVASWSGRFEIPDVRPDTGWGSAVDRITMAVSRQMVAIEAERGRQERPDNPTALDLLLRAWSLLGQAPSPGRMADATALLERALQLDPSSPAVQVTLADTLLDEDDMQEHGRKAVLMRTTELLAKARTHMPTSYWMQLATLHWLAWQDGRCSEVIEAGGQMINAYPSTAQAYRWVGDCENRTGQADEAIPVLERAIRLSPGEGYQSHNYRNLQYSLLLLGRYDESISWGERALAANAEDNDFERARLQRRLAAAYALTGRIAEARRRLAESMQLQPYVTLRGLFSIETFSPTYTAQVGRVSDGLRLAGMRDHADEMADFGIPSDDRLHPEFVGPTPVTAPGATTILTNDLAPFLAAQKSVVIDTVRNSERRSIAGAIGLRYVGDGGQLSDLAQDRLRVKMQQLTNGNLDAPVIAVGWNSETFDGRNLALRLTALGYTRVYWYRGGREAWEVQALPETDLMLQDW